MTRRDLFKAGSIDERIAGLVVDGWSNQEIADELGFALGTIKWRLHRLYKALEVRSRVQFVQRIREVSDDSGA